MAFDLVSFLGGAGVGGAVVAAVIKGVQKIFADRYEDTRKLTASNREALTKMLEHLATLAIAHEDWTKNLNRSGRGSERDRARAQLDAQVAEAKLKNAKEDLPAPVQERAPGS